MSLRRSRERRRHEARTQLPPPSPRDEQIAQLKSRLHDVEMENRMLERNKRQMADTYEKILSETNVRYKEQLRRRIVLAKEFRRLSGDVRVNVMRGRDLVAADVGDTSDPYCVVKIVDENNRQCGIEQRTAVVHKNRLSPVWNAEFSEWKFPVHTASILPLCSVLVEIWDEDLFRPDDFMGQVVVKLSDIPEGHSITEWYEVQPRPDTLDLVSGDLRIKLCWKSMNYVENTMEDSSSSSSDDDDI